MTEKKTHKNPVRIYEDTLQEIESWQLAEKHRTGKRLSIAEFLHRAWEAYASGDKPLQNQPDITVNPSVSLYTPEEQEQIDALVWVLREGGEDAAGMIRAVLKQLANRRPPQSKATPEKRRKRA